ncbi:fibrous sheath CABYR-binding protein [Lucilia sericata]|uniref:fibrous sheath CABYR-binding protein n=1 Tax=Lucilia sericata TaxID=13632 RepID=UPI0018A86B3E|nr:fibrous sheath CABYR-binding protein [Lucilia sericata]
MAQFKKISLIILVLAIVACSAEPARYRQRLAAKKLQPLRQRPAVPQKRVLARQEAVTPYPTADELKPEVPFEEGNQPDEVYGPPDETYGPPELDETPADQLPSEEAPEEFAPNPDAEEFQPAEEESVAPVEEEQVSRLTNRRKSNKKNISSRLVQKKKAKKSQRLVVAPAPVVAPAASVPVALPFATPYTAQSQQYYLLNQPFAYTAQYQAW